MTLFPELFSPRPEVGDSDRAKISIIRRTI